MLLLVLCRYFYLNFENFSIADRFAVILALVYFVEQHGPDLCAWSPSWARPWWTLEFGGKVCHQSWIVVTHQERDILVRCELKTTRLNTSETSLGGNRS